MKKKTYTIVWLLVAVMLLTFVHTIGYAETVQSGYLTYEEPTTQSSQSSWVSTIAYLFSLLVVFLFVSGMAYFVSKLIGQKLGGVGLSKSSRVLESLPLGANKSLCIVEMAGKVMLIGVSDHNITLLKEITDEMEIVKLRAQAEELKGQSDFNHIFEKQLISLEELSRRIPAMLKKKDHK